MQTTRYRLFTIYKATSTYLETETSQVLITEAPHIYIAM